MKTRANRERFLEGVGSVMDLCPATDYSEHIPQGSTKKRLDQYMSVANSYLEKEIDRHEQITCRGSVPRHRSF